MNEADFIKKHSASWESLRTMAAKIDAHGISKLSSQEVKEFMGLFRACSRHLACARTHFPQSPVCKYLNSLVGKSHNMTYGVQKFNPSAIIKYFKKDFPEYLKEERIYILVSAGIFLCGFILSLFLTLYKNGNASYFLPDAFIKGAQGPKADGSGAWNYPLMSGSIMINNISVALRAFAFGITLGLGTVYILFYNGLILGSLTALIYSGGAPFTYWSLILPHGITELTAIFISGGTGLCLGCSILFPGKYSRKHSAILGAKRAVLLISGVVFMLIIAAIIEGFFTPLNISPMIKLLFALTTLVLLSCYFALPYVRKK